MNQELIEQVTEIAATVAKQIHPRYKVYFEPADIRQDLILWALKRPNKISEWLNPDQEPADLKAGIKQLAKSMQREADKQCRKEKARACGYETQDEYFYNTGVIEELLANLDEVEHQSTGTQVRVSGGGGDPATGNNFIASVMDVRRALDQLSPTDQLIIEMRYQQAYTYDQIANALELSDTTVHRRVKSSLRKMLKFLGGDNPWISQGRKSMSNSKAQAITAQNN